MYVQVRSSSIRSLSYLIHVYIRKSCWLLLLNHKFSLIIDGREQRVRGSEWWINHGRSWVKRWRAPKSGSDRVQRRKGSGKDVKKKEELNNNSGRGDFCFCLLRVLPRFSRGETSWKSIYNIHFMSTPTHYTNPSSAQLNPHKSPCFMKEISQNIILKNCSPAPRSVSA